VLADVGSHVAVPVVIELVGDAGWVNMAASCPLAAWPVPRSRSWPAGASPDYRAVSLGSWARQVATDEPVTVQRSNPAQRTGCG
jgi:hypothetical protein